MVAERKTFASGARWAKVWLHPACRELRKAEHAVTENASEPDPDDWSFNTEDDGLDIPAELDRRHELNKPQTGE